MDDLFDFQEKWEELVDKANSGGYESLSPDEKVWLNAQYLTNSIGNGGLISYYYNSPADTLEDCLKALEILGATRMKGLMERINRLFPGGVPKDVAARNEIINSWPKDDENLEELHDDIENAALSEMTKVESRLVEFIQQTGIGT
jgi:hypothetical protein